MSRSRLSRSVLACCLAGSSLATFACSGAEDSSPEESETDTLSESVKRAPFPALPSPTLAVPEGNRLAFYLDAVGVQIYVCQASATGVAWTLKAPEATLYDQRGRVAGTHYAGPTWQANDGSKVVGTRLAGFTDDPSAIPALLLQAASTEGAGRMKHVTYIQRLETTGGLAPSTGCDADHVNATTRVDYTATYYFYSAKCK